MAAADSTLAHEAGRAGVQDSRGRDPTAHAALELGSAGGLVCTDTTEQLLAPCGTF